MKTIKIELNDTVYDDFVAAIQPKYLIKNKTKTIKVKEEVDGKEMIVEKEIVVKNCEKEKIDPTAFLLNCCINLVKKYRVEQESKKITIKTDDLDLN